MATIWTVLSRLPTRIWAFVGFIFVIVIIYLVSTRGFSESQSIQHVQGQSDVRQKYLTYLAKQTHSNAKVSEIAHINKKVAHSTSRKADGQVAQLPKVHVPQTNLPKETVRTKDKESIVESRQRETVKETVKEAGNGDPAPDAEVPKEAPQLVPDKPAREDSDPGKPLPVDALPGDLFGKEKVIHFDLKGAAPKLPYLLSLIPVLKQWGVTGILLEYEDMFPYEGQLNVLQTKRSYKKSELEELLKAIQDNGMIPIPLIQTLGHMEFVLKTPTFEAMREDLRYPDFLNAGHPETMNLLTGIIDQMMSVHGKIPYLHIGADEVGMMGTSKEALQLMGENKLETNEDLYLFHLKRVAGYIQQKYPDVKVLVWDDMIRHMSLDSIKRSSVSSLVEPMVWNYLPDITQRLDESVWEKYASVFTNVWVASAFKGASGPAQHLPDLNVHIANHLSWIETAAWLREAHPKINIQGIVLTGWSRFDHFSALCDLLPASIPSLAVCLEILKKNTWKMDMVGDVMEMLKCSVPSSPEEGSPAIISKNAMTNQYSYVDVPPHCDFQGKQLYKAMVMYHRILNKFEKYFDPITGKTRGHCNRFSMGHDFIDPLRVDNLCSKAATETLTAFREFENVVHDSFTPIYSNDVIAEWLEEHVISFERWLQEYDARVKTSAAKSRVWGQRPDRHVDKLADDNLKVVVPSTN